MKKISKASFVKLFALLIMGYEWFGTDSDEKTKVWYNFLCDIDEDLLKAVVGEWIAMEPNPPTIADLRNKCALKVLAIPTALEAWQVIESIYIHNTSNVNLRDMPSIVREALKSIGGGGLVQRSDQPSITRSQYLKAYESLTDQRARELNVNHKLDTLPTKEITGGVK